MNIMNYADKKDIANQLNFDYDYQLIKRLKKSLRGEVYADKLEDIDNLTVQGMYNLINKAYKEFPKKSKYEDIFDVLTRYINNYYSKIGPILESLNKLRETIEYLEEKPHSKNNKYSKNNKLSFNVKMPELYDNVNFENILDHIKDKYKNRPDYKKLIEDYNTVEKIKEETNRIIYEDYISYLWNDIRSKLFVVFGIERVRSAGRNSGWMIVDYEYPKTFTIDAIIKEIKNYNILPGEYLEGLNRKVTTEKIINILNELQNIGDFIEEERKEAIEDFQQYIIDTIEANINHDLIDLSEVLDIELSNYSDNKEKALYEIKEEWCLGVLEDNKYSIIKMVKDSIDKDKNSFKNYVKSNILYKYAEDLRNNDYISDMKVSNLKLMFTL